ncbi:MAG: hypothetical protein J0L84_17180, partial [Verrucomicrobia bacterium]|nr:hypothetical protein [Verrucomicrobiota bacterium]
MALVVIVIQTFLGRAEEVLWCRSLSVDQGLSQNMVTAMAQDSQGYLWFGTLGGLSRWNGYEFASFPHVRDDPATPGDSEILALHRDQGGTLWAGTRRGVDRFRPAEGAFERWDSRASAPKGGNTVPAAMITSDRAGRLWFASFTDSRLHRLEPHLGRETVHPLPDPRPRRITALHVDQSDRLWVATQPPEEAAAPGDLGFRLYLWDGCSEIGDGPLPVPQQPFRLEETGGRVLTLLEDRVGRLWIGLNGGGLLRFDP